MDNATPRNMTPSVPPLFSEARMRLFSTHRASCDDMSSDCRWRTEGRYRVQRTILEQNKNGHAEAFAVEREKAPPLKVEGSQMRVERLGETSHPCSVETSIANAIGLPQHTNSSMYAAGNEFKHP